jgi:peptide/nickel transport system substrate-binding protein
VQNPVLQDVRVRQALSLSIDREKFNAFAFQGKRFVSSSFAHSAIVTTAPQTKSFNPEEAAALLDAAGFKKGSDGVLVNDKQQRLSFSFLTVRDDPSFTTLQQLIANAWREAGIETTLESAPLRDLEQRIMPQRLFTGVALLRTTMPHNIQVPPMFLASISIPNAENAYRGENYSGWQNEMADRLLAALTTTIDPSAANANYNVLESLYKTELPTLPLYFTPALSVFPTAFEGIAITAGHNAQTLGAENWFFTPPAAVKIRKERELF